MCMVCCYRLSCVISPVSACIVETPVTFFVQRTITSDCTTQVFERWGPSLMIADAELFGVGWCLPRPILMSNNFEAMDNLSSSSKRTQSSLKKASWRRNWIFFAQETRKEKLEPVKSYQTCGSETLTVWLCPGVRRNVAWYRLKWLRVHNHYYNKVCGFTEGTLNFMRYSFVPTWKADIF